jgi:ATP-binding cassette subfamily C protein LapB
VLELVTRIVVVDNGRVVLDGPRDQVLAALSGVKPSAPTAGAGSGSGAGAGADLLRHPANQPVQQQASI